jgi:hypothetical protein
MNAARPFDTAGFHELATTLIAEIRDRNGGLTSGRIAVPITATPGVLV